MIIEKNISLPILIFFVLNLLALSSSSVNHTSTWVTAVYREVWVCYIISTLARATPNSVVADWVWTTDIWSLNTFIHIFSKRKITGKK